MAGGRPEITIDWKQVDNLLLAGCSGSEIAAYLGIHKDTLYDQTLRHFKVSFTDYSVEKRQKGESILRAKQFELASKGDKMMLIWLGKNRLRQKDTPDDVIVSEEIKSQFEALMGQLTSMRATKSSNKTNNESMS